LLGSICTEQRRSHLSLATRHRSRPPWTVHGCLDSACERGADPLPWRSAAVERVSLSCQISAMGRQGRRSGRLPKRQSASFPQTNRHTHGAVSARMVGGGGRTKGLISVDCQKKGVNTHGEAPAARHQRPRPPGAPTRGHVAPCAPSHRRATWRHRRSCSRAARRSTRTPCTMTTSCTPCTCSAQQIFSPFPHLCAAPHLRPPCSRTSLTPPLPSRRPSPPPA